MFYIRSIMPLKKYFESIDMNYNLPKVVMTIQMARQTAINTVTDWENGAGQHSGPHGVERVPETKRKWNLLLIINSINSPLIQKIG